jgi:hypothetical protein
MSLYSLLSFLKILRTVEIGDGDFIKKDLKFQNKMLHLNQNLLKLNFPELFKDENGVFYIIKDKNIFIWTNNYPNSITLPEGYILSKVLNDGVYIFKTNAKEKLLIIKNNFEIQESIKNRFSDYELNLLSYSFSLNTTRYEENEYNDILNRAKVKISSKDILQIIQSKMDYEKSSKKLTQKLARVFFIVTIIISAFVFAKGYMLDEKYQEISNQYKKIKHKSIETNNKLEKIKELERFYKSTSSIIEKNDAIDIYMMLIKNLTIKDKIKTLHISYNSFRFGVESAYPIKIVEKLEDEKLLYDVKIVSNNKHNVIIKGKIKGIQNEQ